MNRITLKGMKYARFSSEETNCFEATVLFDGVPVCIASNDGRGGCDMHRPVKGMSGAEFRQRLDALEAHVKTLPKITTPYPDPQDPTGKMVLDPSLDLVVGELVEAEIALRDLRRHLTRKVLFLKRGDDPAKGSFRTIKLPNGSSGASTDAAISYVERTYPGAVILNKMPEAEALKVWRAS